MPESALVLLVGSYQRNMITCEALQRLKDAAESSNRFPNPSHLANCGSHRGINLSNSASTTRDAVNSGSHSIRKINNAHGAKPRNRAG